MSDPFTGEIRMFAGGFAPRSWALCDGQLLNISQNDALFSLLGTIYGGDGRSTFGLPDLRGRVPIHNGSGPGLTPRRLGQKSGTESVTLVTSQLPQHTHALRGTADFANATQPEGRVPGRNNAGNQWTEDEDAQGMAGQAIGQTGGSQPHTNEMPFLCVNFIIALFGIYPSRS